MAIEVEQILNNLRFFRFETKLNGIYAFVKRVSKTFSFFKDERDLGDKPLEVTFY